MKIRLRITIIRSRAELAGKVMMTRLTSSMNPTSGCIEG
jgi:hypothetical protein